MPLDIASAAPPASGTGNDQGVQNVDAFGVVVVEALDQAAAPTARDAGGAALALAVADDPGLVIHGAETSVAGVAAQASIIKPLAVAGSPGVEKSAVAADQVGLSPATSGSAVAATADQAVDPLADAKFDPSALVAAAPSDPGSPTGLTLPPNGASVELTQFEEHLGQLNTNLETTKGVVTDAKEIVIDVKDLLGTFGDIEEKANTIGNIVDVSAVVVKLLGKISFLKPIALPFEQILKKVSHKIGIIEKKAGEIDEKLQPAQDKLQLVEDKLELVETKFDVATARIEKVEGSVADANKGLDTAKALATEQFPGTPFDTALTQVINGIDAVVHPANVAVGGINTTFATVETKVTELKNSITIDTAVFQQLKDFNEALNQIESSLAFLKKPLAVVNKVIEPLKGVFDAIGLLFAPVEFAIKAVLKATGIQSLIDKVGAFITGLIPNFGILDTIENAVTNTLNGFFAPILDEVLSPIDDFVNGIKDSFVLPALTAPTTGGNDSFLGDSDGNLVLASAGNDFIAGGAGNDTLNGGDGSDMLIGGAGNDTIDGGTSGADRDTVTYSGSITEYEFAKLAGGPGDVGIWQITHNRPASDANNGMDIISNIEDLVFDDFRIELLGVAGIVTTQSQPGAPVRVDTTGLANKTSTNGKDVIIGDVGYDDIHAGDGADSIVGRANALATINGDQKPGDILDGEAGNDVITVASAADVVLGGSGQDTASYRNLPAGTGIGVYMPTGTDYALYRPTFSFNFHLDQDIVGRVNPQANNAITNQILLVENLIGTGSADYLWGDSLTNTINGLAGNDFIRGLGDRDHLIGDVGNDTLIGDRGDDFAFGGTGDDFFVGGLNDPLSFLNFAEDNYFGDEGYDTVWYGASDTLAAGGTTTGIAGLDALQFGSTGPADHDLAFHLIAVLDDFFVNPLDREAYGVVGTVQKLDAGNQLIGTDHLVSIEAFYGSNGADQITGARQDDFIDAGPGDDTVTGGNGANYLAGGGGADRIVVSSAAQDTVDGGAGNDEILAMGDISFQDIYNGGFGTDTLDLSASLYSWRIDTSQALANAIAVDPLTAADPVTRPGLLQLYTHQLQSIEIIKGSIFRDVIKLGPAGGQTALGGEGDDNLISLGTGNALAGGDTLSGGAGNDTLATNPNAVFNAFVTFQLDGGIGDDELSGSAAREVFIGGDGIDTLTYRYNPTTVTVDMVAQTGTQDDTFTGIENVTGSEFDDVIYGDGGANVLLGLAGADFIDGSALEDIVYGGAGNDLLQGGDGDDFLHGGDGDDALDGGAGIDTASWEEFQLHPDSQQQFVANFFGISADLALGTASGQVIDEQLTSIENLFGSAQADEFFGDGAANVLSGAAGDDRLEGRGGNDTLLGGDGSDQLLGGDNDDFIAAGRGFNEIIGGAGRDTLDYSSATRGLEVSFAGVGLSTGLDYGRILAYYDTSSAVWADSVINVPDPLGGPGDVIQIGSDEARLVSPGVNVTPDRLLKLDPAFATSPADLIPVAGLPSLLPAEFEFSVITRVQDALDTFKEIEVLNTGYGDDSILGNTEANEIHANAGDDTMRGGGGNDTLDGGFGNDRAVYAGTRAQYTFAGTLTNLTVTDGTANRDGVDNLIDVETVQFADGTFTVSALLGIAAVGAVTIGDVTITEGNAGTSTATFTVTRTGGTAAFAVGYATADDTAIAGADYLAASGTLNFGVDVHTQTVVVTINGETQEEDNETFVVDLSGATNGATIADDQARGAILNDDGVQLFSAGNDVVTVPTSGGVWHALGGNDFVTGTAGTDELHGDEGTDTLAGAAGNDAYYVDTFLDLIIENADEGTDTVVSSESYIFHANVENLALTGTGGFGVIGNDLANMITGNSGGNGITGGAGNDTIDSGDGNDVIDGGIGNDDASGGPGSDVYFIDSALDTITDVVEEGVFDIVWTIVSMTLPDNVEILILNGGNIAINGTGNDGFAGNAPNLMLGNNEVNTLTTFGGNDIILGLDGNDTITTGAGSPTGVEIISGGIGNDMLTSGGGHDFFTYAAIGEGGDTITDFGVAGDDLDILDFRPMFFPTFTGTAGIGSVAAAVTSGHLTYTQSGANTQVFADANGGGNNNVLLATLQNTNAGLAQLLTLI